MGLRAGEHRHKQNLSVASVTCALLRAYGADASNMEFLRGHFYRVILVRCILLTFTGSCVYLSQAIVLSVLPDLATCS